MTWFLLQCKPNQQSRAELNLGNQGYHTFCPRMQVKRLIRRRPEVRTEPVFPGYLFIRLGADSNWRSLLATRGISRIVSFNGHPHPVPDALIQALNKRFANANVPAPLFKPGERVRVTDGCFRDLEVIVSAVTADERIVVLLKLLQREQRIVMDAQQLSPTA